MIKKILALALSYLLLLNTSGFAALPNSTFLHELGQKYMRAFSQEEKFTALAITVSNNKKTHSAYLGTRGINHDVIIDRTCLFQTGSITKSFIAALILKLEADLKYHFSIDDPIDKFFPEYKKWHNITIKNLLQMTSGIPDYLNDPINLIKYSKNPRSYYQPSVWINDVLKKPLQFKPGTRFQYSNSNYVLLGLIIEKITNHSLQTELQEKIIAPLGLTYTYYVPPQSKNVFMTNHVHGYQAQNNLLSYIPLGTDITNYNISYLHAAGCMYGTTEDISKWIKALFTPGKVLTAAQLKKLTHFISEKSAQSVTNLNANDNLAYGFGISAEYDTQLNKVFYVYEGVTLGYRFLYLYEPKEKIVITIATNSNNMPKENRLLALAKLIYVKYTLP